MLERVCSVVSDVLGVPGERVTAATTHEDLDEWDSLNLINLLMALEAEFGVTLEVDDAAELVSVEKIVEKLQERGA